MTTIDLDSIKEYISEPLIGCICNELWHALKRRLLSYIKRYQSKRQKGAGKHAPFIFNSPVIPDCRIYYQ